MQSAKSISDAERNGKLIGCPTVFLDDAPIDADQLALDKDSSPHEKLAETIAQLIVSPSETKPTMIAVEGSWGSGKSTVITMLQKRLKGSLKVTVFLFDAWAHEGDPLRRTFLESLIRHFLSKNWIGSKKWEAELEKLAKRQRHSFTKSLRTTTRFGRLLAISALLIPLGSLLLSDALRQGIVFDFSRPVSWMFISGLLFTCAPLLVALIKLILLLPKLMKGKATRGDWAFLAQDENSEMTQETTESPEPTSIEFEDKFRDLLEEVINVDQQRIAVVVLDNLDRVDSKTALSIWSTLQIFLRFNSSSSRDLMKRLFVIVPYDRTGMLRLWENRNLPSGGNSEHVDISPRESTAESFLEKSFQIRFQVPPIVLSNWKKYLIDKAKKALPGHSLESLDVIYQVFNAYRGPKATPPTPRELKLFINQIGTVHMQWQDTFPVGHIAYFVLLCRDGNDVRKLLLQGEFPDKAISYLIPYDASVNLSTSLAAMWFNVRAVIAQQMLLSEPIAQALERKDATVLQKSFSEDPEAFWAVLEEVVRPFLESEALPIKIANVAGCLDEFGISQYPGRLESLHVISYVKSAFERISVWSPFGSEVASGLSAACRLISDKEFIRRIIETVRNTISAQTQPRENMPPLDTLIEGCVLLSEQVDRLGQHEALGSPFKLPCTSVQWLEASLGIFSREKRWWSLFIPQEPLSAISAAIANIITTGKATQSILAAIQVTNASFGFSSEWDVVTKAIEDRLNPAINVPTKESVPLFQILGYFVSIRSEVAVQTLQRLVDSGHLMHALFTSQQANDAEAKALFISIALEHHPNAAKQKLLGQSEGGYLILTNSLASDDEKLARLLIDHLIAEQKLPLLFAVADARPTYDPLIVRCLQIVADSPKPTELFAPVECIKRWRALRDNINDAQKPERFADLVAYLCENSDFISVIQSPERSFRYEDVGLYLTIVNKKSSPPFVVWCISGLQGLAKETWLLELEKIGEALDLVTLLVASRHDISLRVPFQDAMRDYAQKAIGGALKIAPDIIKRRTSIFEAMASSSRTVLRALLRNLAMEQNGKLPEGFFEMFGEELSNKTTLAEDDDIIIKLFSPLVEQRSLSGLSWLKQVFKNQPKLLAEYTDEEKVENFRDRLASELKKAPSNNDPVQAILVEISTALESY